MNTFSVNSLKLLNLGLEEFEKKYIYHLEFLNKNEIARRGERLHALICYYIECLDIEKIENSLPQDEKELFEQIKQLPVFSDKSKFIKTEESFLVKIARTSGDFYLTGRFDAVFKDNEEYVIYDWKTKNIPKKPEEDLQTIVYLLCASRIFKTQNASICYLSLETKQSVRIKFENEELYLKKICAIVDKLPKKYLT